MVLSAAADNFVHSATVMVEKCTQNSETQIRSVARATRSMEKPIRIAR